MKRPLLAIFLIMLVDVLAFTLVIPLLAIYAETYGASPLVATSLVTTYSALQLVSGPLLGRVSDRFGRRPVLIVSQIGTFAGLLLMARADALWMLFAARAIDGATAGNLPLAQAYISDNTDPEKRASAFALIGIAFGVGFFAGPSLTAILSQYGIAVPIYLAAALSLISILCTTFVLPPGRPPQVAGPGARLFAWPSSLDGPHRAALRGLLGQIFVFGFAFSIFLSGFALFAERRFTWKGHAFGPHEIGVVFAYLGLMGIVVQGGLLGRFVKRFGEARIALTGFGLLALSAALLAPAHTLGALVIVASLVPFADGFIRPTLTSLLSQKAERTEQGAVLGLAQSLQSVAQIFAPLLGGFLIGQGLLAAWAAMTAIAACLGIALARFGSGRADSMPASAAA